MEKGMGHQTTGTSPNAQSHAVHFIQGDAACIGAGSTRYSNGTEVMNWQLFIAGAVIAYLSFQVGRRVECDRWYHRVKRLEFWATEHGYQTEEGRG
jgi:hypothetical protein